MEKVSFVNRKTAGNIFHLLVFLLLVGKGYGQAVIAHASPGSGVSTAPECLIGYTELQTNLPGGRQANVNTMRAMVMTADGTAKRSLAAALADTPNTMTQFVGWSPDGTTAIIGQGWKSPENALWEEENKGFRHSEGNVKYDSYLVDIEKGTLVNLTAVDRVSHYNSGMFFWPGDPTHLGFTALINNVSHPFKMDREGKNKVDLTRNADGFTYGFSSSKDGTRVAYHKDYQVYLANADGADPQRVATGQAFNFGPQWSPDGKWVLFLAGKRNIDCHPYRVRADGTGLEKLADRNGYKGAVEFLDVYDFHEGSSDVPVWSADGKSVFYTALIDNAVELFRVFPGHEPIRLTYSPEGTLHYHPNPSADGKWLLYGSKRKGVRDLYRMRLSDYQEKQITKNKPGTAAMWPHWQPRTQR